jgi:hypothetical protein
VSVRQGERVMLHHPLAIARLAECRHDVPEEGALQTPKARPSEEVFCGS